MDKKSDLISQIKDLARKLGVEYGTNIKLEVNVNEQYSSVKINVTEYVK